MAKNVDVRIAETLNEIPRLVRGNGVFIKEAIHAWLQNHPADQAAIGKDLSLGSRGLGKKSATVTQERHYRRALLLAKRTIGGVTGGTYTALKKNVEQLSEAQCRTQLENLYRTAAPIVVLGNGDPVFGSSFDVIPEEKPACTAAVQKAIAAMEKALTDGVRSVKTNPAERERFITWFGNTDAVRITKVESVLESIYKEVHRKTIKLYNRGKLGALAKLVQDDVAGANLVTDYGYQTYDNRRDTHYIHLFIGSLWFLRSGETSVFDGTKTNNRVSRAGTIIHELSHAVCKTADADWKGSSKMYYPKICKEAAAEQSDFVINNADTYRLYCEEFFTP